MRLLLFAGDPVLARAAEAAGVDRIVVDLERRRKRTRQHGYHLECSGETIDDLRRTRAAIAGEIVCRINPPHAGTPEEVDEVVRAGADVIMLPMFASVAEVDAFLTAVGGRATTSLLFETPEALELAPALASAAFDELYVGLNDLALACHAPFCYQLVRDGVVDRLRARFPDRPFGFGGVTVADGGVPLPTRLIAAEQSRLRCTDVILRRAFKRDVQDRDLKIEVDRLHALYDEHRARSPRTEASDRRRFDAAVDDVVIPGLVPVGHRQQT